MSEPELIRSSASHQVSISEGSKVAGGKKVGATEHSVRETLVGEDSAPVQKQAPEPKLSARISPAAAPPALDLPAAVQVTAEEEGDALPLPAVFEAAREPEASVMLIQRITQEEVIGVADLPEPVQISDAATALLPEGLPGVRETSDKQDDVPGALAPHVLEDALVHAPDNLLPAGSAPDSEAPPVIERTESEHRIALPEGSAAPDLSPAQTPVLERFEQDLRTSLPEPLPQEQDPSPVDAPVLLRSEQDQVVAVPQALGEHVEQAEAEAPVLERSLHESMTAVPEHEAEAATPASEGPVMSRASGDTVVEVPPDLPSMDAAAEGPLIARHEDEHMAMVPPAEAGAPESANGPIVNRVESDTPVAVPEGAASEPPAEGLLITRNQSDDRVALPEASASGPSAKGPLITRSENNNRVAVPEATPQMVSKPDTAPQAAARTPFGLPEAALSEPEEIIEIVEVSDAPQILEVAGASSSPASEPQIPAELVAPGASRSEHQMAQMNFPARVIKLKIANDKVRVQLDALEAPERPGR
jgi:hypothetical protein